MWYGMLVVVCVLLSICLPAWAAGESMTEFQRDSLDLNGQWTCLLGNADKPMWRPRLAGRRGDWKTVTVPGGFTRRLGVARKDFATVDNVWARRRFMLTGAQARRSAVLKYGGVRFGATVWVNGRKVSEHPVIGPHAIELPAGLLRPGPNVLVMKIPGWAGIPKSASGYPLIPTGSGTQPWGSKASSIYDDIWLDFHDGVYIKHALAMPDPVGGKVTFRIALGGTGRRGRPVTVSARVVGVNAKRAAGRGEATIQAGQPGADLTVSIRGAKLWTPLQPNLYRAELTVRVGPRTYDRVAFRFGMRRVHVRRGRYRLNGKPLWFRGSNLVTEWLWDGAINRDVKRYLIDIARQMNLNSFRTHTLPPSARWLDVADEHGMMIWAELPVLYNNRNFKFTPAEFEVFHKHALLDSTGWVTKLWNHPSVTMWVLSNESRDDNKWETGPFYEHVKRLDPTRLCLRSGGPGGTPDIMDVHTCGNYGGPAEGSALQQFAKFANRESPRRPLSNSEYMNTFNRRRSYALRWLGSEQAYEPTTFAEFAAEHTEAMRRLRYDGILPYMYAGWTGMRRHRQWRKDYPTPMAAALHSSMAPVLASLDLFDRNFTAGEEVATRTVLINELHQDVAATVDVCVTPVDPLFVPDEKALSAAVWRKRFALTFKADSFAERTVRWKVPAAEGVYYLALVVRRPGDAPVVSQRVVRSVDPAKTLEGLKKRPLVLLGGTVQAGKWLKARDIPFVKSVRKGQVDGEVAVIWSVTNLTRSPRLAKALRSFVSAGGRLVILNHREWKWKRLADFKLEKQISSRAFAYPKASHPVLTGIDPELLKRFNGIPGTIAERVITGPAAEEGKKLLWIVDPDKPVLISLGLGKGEILISTLDLKRRLGRPAKYRDPVAERILLNLLCR